MYRIIKKTPYWFVLSGTLMTLSVVAIFIFGLRLSIDYKGGTVIEFDSKNKDKVALTDEVLKLNNFDSYQIKEAGEDQVIIKLPVLTNDQHVELTKSFTAKMTDYKEMSYDTVGPTISRDLTFKSIEAVILASLGIILYIAFAFRKLPKPLSSWKFGTSAVIAIIHDLLITTGVVVVIGHFYTWMEIDTLFITALLTIMGFSVHDTIVVYDRLRENFIKNPHQDIELTAEESINQTLARSINTSLIVIFVLLALLLLGGSSIRHFVLTLIVGIFFGTYSSIFVATAIVVMWQKKKKNILKST